MVWMTFSKLPKFHGKRKTGYDLSVVKQKRQHTSVKPSRWNQPPPYLRLIIVSPLSTFIPPLLLFSLDPSRPFFPSRLPSYWFPFSSHPPPLSISTSLSWQLYLYSASPVTHTHSHTQTQFITVSLSSLARSLMLSLPVCSASISSSLSSLTARCFMKQYQADPHFQRRTRKAYRFSQSLYNNHTVINKFTWIKSILSTQPSVAVQQVNWTRKIWIQNTWHKISFILFFTRVSMNEIF